MAKKAKKATKKKPAAKKANRKAVKRGKHSPRFMGSM